MTRQVSNYRFEDFPPIGVPFVANHGDGCYECFDWIRVGHIIARVKRDKYAHVNCDNPFSADGNCSDSVRVFGNPQSE